ncbi:hypothetical protein TW86_04090 [Halomonas sp. S2151]|uniref:hypothetical protein n=1 Tax=Halomonas sp. S2151 TaxID=579478 RepID=UPI0005FA5C72|nr:hypothetical protein [Halomonas sp. S2151]KJZ17440.1 hypothetical protein TW86_04090 [Halomonas sp. S2151]
MRWLNKDWKKFWTSAFHGVIRCSIAPIKSLIESSATEFHRPVRFAESVAMVILTGLLSLLLLLRNDFDGGAAVSLFTIGVVGASAYFLYPRVKVISVGNYVVELNDAVSRSEDVIEKMENSLKNLYRLQLGSEVKATCAELEMESRGDYRYYSRVTELSGLFRTLEKEGLLGEMSEMIEFSVNEVARKIKDCVLGLNLTTALYYEVDSIERAMVDELDRLVEIGSMDSTVKSQWISLRLSDIRTLKGWLDKLPQQPSEENPSA